MFIISNNVLGRVNIKPEAVVRLNLAWVKSKSEARSILFQIENDIYLDYPSGRTKPPKPTITIEDAIEICNEFKPKFFAVSNVENPDQLNEIKEKIPAETEIVPKIETEHGVINFRNIVKGAGIKTAMLDKEDLYTSNKERYEQLVDMVRLQAKEYRVNLLEMAGVIFL